MRCRYPEPGTDRDKFHLTSDPTNSDLTTSGTCSGTNTWEHKWCPNSWYSPGDSWMLSDPGTWYCLVDNSCWMASADNMVEYRYGIGRYNSWAYQDGITGTFTNPWGSMPNATYTFNTSGLANYCLQNEGYAWAIMAQSDSSHPSSFSWVDPADYIAACLRAGSPVGIGIWNGWSSGHALTVYAINTQNRTITLADSDADWNGKDFTTFSYALSGQNLTIAYPTSQQNVHYICSFDDVGWWTGGTGTWENTSNWAARHLPTSDQPIYLTQSNLGTVTISASCLTVGQANVGSITQSTGTLDASNASIVLGANVGSQGTYNLTGGS